MVDSKIKRIISLIAKQLRTNFAIVLTLIIVCVVAASCTFGSAVKDDKTTNVEKMTSVGSEVKLSSTLKEKEKEEKTTTKKAKLYKKPIKNKVCVCVQPSVIRECVYYYYIPSGKKQEKLLNLMKNIETTWQRVDIKKRTRSFVGMKETGWKIVYNDTEYMALEGGFLYAYNYDDTEMEIFTRQKKLCNTVERMLERKLDYKHIDVSQIKDIVSAKLEITGFRTDGQLYSQTITDKKRLRLLEKWFKNAEYIFGGAECGSQQASMELKLATGMTVKLSIATDSCTIFGINGVYYDYRPKKYRKSGGMYADDLFKYFSELPQTVKVCGFC